MRQRGLKIQIFIINERMFRMFRMFIYYTDIYAIYMNVRVLVQCVELEHIFSGGICRKSSLSLKSFVTDAVGNMYIIKTDDVRLCPPCKFRNFS